MMYSARAVLCNGQSQYEDALAAASEAAADPLELGPTKWALAELVEAGVRSGHTDVAAGAFEQLSAMTHASGTELALGIEAARRALLRDDATPKSSTWRRSSGCGTDQDSRRARSCAAALR